LWALEAEQPWEVHLSWSAAPGHCDALFLPRAEGEPRRVVGLLKPGGADGRPWGAYANRPVGPTAGRLVPTLREHLRGKLPEAMVPSAFVLLDALPLTPNGKLDRRALPAPDRPSGAGSASAAPGNQLERKIAAAWQESLGLDEVGVNDNFFDLGGHSLLLVQLHLRLRELLDADLAIVDLFRFPTIRALAQFLSSDGTPGPAWGDAPPRQAAAGGGELGEGGKQRGG
jgi:acyl carrier protein